MGPPLSFFHGVPTSDLGKRFIVSRASRNDKSVVRLITSSSQKAPPVSPSTPAPLPEGSKVKLSVVTGLRVGKSYALKDGATYIGRLGPQQVDVDSYSLQINDSLRNDR